MFRFASPLTLVATLALGLAPSGGALAQDTAPSGPGVLPGAGLPLGEEVIENGMGDTYVAGEFGDWTKLCQRMEDGSDPCGLTQLMTDSEGNPVAEITIFPLPPGGEAVAGANMITPLGTLLTQQISISVDGGTTRRYPFLFCDVGGCYAQIGLTAAMVESFRRGSEATVTIASVAAPDQPVDLTLSLSGFTAGYSALPQP
ncbi:MAG: invasion associated locus B family protein [Alkalilacustris sp.]